MQGREREREICVHYKKRQRTAHDLYNTDGVDKRVYIRASSVLCVING